MKHRLFRIRNDSVYAVTVFHQRGLAPDNCTALFQQGAVSVNDKIGGASRVLIQHNPDAHSQGIAQGNVAQGIAKQL